MKKNLPLIIVTIILAGILFYLKYTKSKSNFEDAEVRIENVDDIGSIILSDKHGNTTRLRRDGKKWIVNDTIPAEHAKMLILLNTLNKLSVEMPVSETSREIAIDDLRRFAKEVKILDKDGEEIQTFFIGSTNMNGNYMILSKNGVVSSQPYIVKIPGIQFTDLKYRFVADPSTWYTTEVFTTSLEKIKTIKLTYHDKPENSFILEKDEDLIKINPVLEKVKIDKPLNKENVVQFLLEFESKNFEGRLNSDSAINFIKKSNPYCTIEFEDVLDEKRKLILYRMPAVFEGKSNSSTLDAKGNKLPFNIEKYWGYSSYTNEYAIIQHYAFGPILMTYDYFFEPPKK